MADGNISPDLTPPPAVHTKTTAVGVDLEGEQPGWSPDTDGDSSSSTPAVTPIEPGTARCFETDEDICVADRAAPGAPPAEPGAPTITDIATFPVTVGTARNQPTGWGVVNRPTNFYAEGGTHEVTGTLLGNPAIVRFTPVAWHWDYGDGTTASLDRPGKPWNQETQFRPTGTSHVYETKDDFTVTLFIDYIAEYQYAGQPWKRIDGALRVRANDLPIITWRVKTVLVAHDCIQDPKGIGCPGTLTRDDLGH